VSTGSRRWDRGGTGTVWERRSGGWKRAKAALCGRGGLRVERDRKRRWEGGTGAGRAGPALGGRDRRWESGTGAGRAEPALGGRKRPRGDRVSTGRRGCGSTAPAIRARSPRCMGTQKRPRGDRVSTGRRGCGSTAPAICARSPRCTRGESGSPRCTGGESGHAMIACPPGAVAVDLRRQRSVLALRDAREAKADLR
jgi:hypothetical protein